MLILKLSEVSISYLNTLIHNDTRFTIIPDEYAEDDSIETDSELKEFDILYTQDS